MVNDYILKILYFNEIDSTQKYLVEKLKDRELESPVAIVATKQSAGYGSRGNIWFSEKGNLFFSFAIKKAELPSDLKLESISIYMSYLLKEVLEKSGSKIWLKWPNDFYLQDKKVGGTITNIIKDDIVCGIGLNFISTTEEFASLDITIDKEELLANYFANLALKRSWKQVFSNFKVEFEKSKHFSTHYKNEKIEIGLSKLNDDGSLMYKEERIYSLR